MNVGELIEELKKCPKDYEIRTSTTAKEKDRCWWWEEGKITDVIDIEASKIVYFEIKSFCTEDYVQAAEERGKKNNS